MDLRIVRPFARAKPVHQLTQRHQIDCSKRRLAAGYKPELIQRRYISECGGDRAKAPIVTRIDNPVLAPMPPPANQVELATGMRMKGVRDVNLKVGRIHTPSSRRHSPRRKWKSQCRSSNASC